VPEVPEVLSRSASERTGGEADTPDCGSTAEYCCRAPRAVSTQHATIARLPGKVLHCRGQILLQTIRSLIFRCGRRNRCVLASGFSRILGPFSRPSPRLRRAGRIPSRSRLSLHRLSRNHGVAVAPSSGSRQPSRSWLASGSGLRADIAPERVRRRLQRRHPRIQRQRREPSAVSRSASHPFKSLCTCTRRRPCRLRKKPRRRNLRQVRGEGVRLSRHLPRSSPMKKGLPPPPLRPWRSCRGPQEPR
jgi:hypothetical protein